MRTAVTDAPHAVPLKRRHHIAMEDVVFSYDGHEHEPVLQDVDPTLQHDQMVALLGHRLGQDLTHQPAARFYDVQGPGRGEPDRCP